MDKFPEQVISEIAKLVGVDNNIPEPVISKIVKLVGVDDSTVKTMRLVCKQIKNVVDNQVTCISPITISSKRLIVACRRFPNINMLNLKQTIMNDNLVYFGDSDNVQEKFKRILLPFYRCCPVLLGNIYKQKVILKSVEPQLNFHNLISLQILYCFEQHTNVCKLISALSHQISNLEVEFVTQKQGSKQEHNILSLLNSLKQLNNLKILSINYYQDFRHAVGIISSIAQLIQLEELHIQGTVGTEKNAIGQLTTLTNLRKIHLQDIEEHWHHVGKLYNVQYWVDFLSHFQFLHSIMLYGRDFFAWQLLEALVQFRNIQTVGCTLKFFRLSFQIFVNTYVHQQRVALLVQISEIKSELYLEFDLRSCEEVVVDYFRDIPSTCIFGLRMCHVFGPEHNPYFPEQVGEVCEYLQSVDLSNLKKLWLDSKYEYTIDVLNLLKLKQLTYLYLNLFDIDDYDLCDLSNQSNLKQLVLRNFSARHLQALSQVCAKGILQKLVIDRVDFNSALVDSICVPGCNLRAIQMHVKEMTSMQECKRMVQYIFDKFEGVLNRIPRADISSIAEYSKIDIFSIVQQERRRRQLNTISGEIF